jgi:outer membrane protein assembly factor BamB
LVVGPAKATATGTVLALSTKTGKQRWSAPTTSGNSSNSAPIIVGSSVYATDSDISDGHGYLIRFAAP